MFSKAKLLGHPVHAMIVAFPIAFYAATLVSFVVSGFTGDSFWFRLGLVANIAGVVTAAAAAVPGLIDWTAIPSKHPAKSTGLQHLLLNVGALSIFAVNAIIHANRWNDYDASAGLAVALSLVGVGLTLVAGFLGWEMVGNHHVGVNLTAEQERIDLANASRPFANRTSYHGR